jgi:predicted hydrolase (HD superfamily)
VTLIYRVVPLRVARVWHVILVLKLFERRCSAPSPQGPATALGDPDEELTGFVQGLDTSYSRRMSWSVEQARELARHRLAALPDRLAHVSAVAAAAKRIVARGRLDDVVTSAAWLHDIGCCPDVASTGFHALDGARYLEAEGAPSDLVSLVAYHSGAEYEAEERGMAGEMAMFARPRQDQLDGLIAADMTTGPTGAALTIDERLAEILRRYASDDVVHRAIVRARPYLEECVDRTERQPAATR